MNRRVSACLLSVTLAAAPALADEPAPTSPYAEDIQAAAQAIESGRLDEAETLLGGANPEDRGFEFDYLKTALKAAREVGPAPIARVKVPAVPTRYGILNPVTKQIAFISQDGRVRVADATDPEAPAREVATPGDPPQALWSACFSADGRTFAAGNAAGQVTAWDTSTWEQTGRFDLGGKRPVRELALSPDGSKLVAEGEKEMALHDLKSGAKIGAVGPRYNFGEGLAYSPKGDRIATGGMMSVLLFDPADADQKAEFHHASYTMGLAFSPDGTRIASGTRGNVNKLLAVFDAATGRALFNRKVTDNYAVGLAFSPDGRRLAVTGCDHKLRLVDPETGVVILTIPRPDCGVRPAFSADGRMLAWSEPDGVHVIDLGPAPESTP